MVFCDLSIPKGDGKFNVYDDIRSKLIAAGIPADQVAYSIELGESAAGNITRIDNARGKLPEYLDECRAKLANLHQQLESAKSEAAKPFAMEAELSSKSARLAELDAALNLGSRDGTDTAA